MIQLNEKEIKNLKKINECKEISLKNCHNLYVEAKNEISKL